MKNGMIRERDVPLEYSSDMLLVEEQEKNPQFFHHVHKEILEILP